MKLGENTVYPSKYNPCLLEGIPRKTPLESVHYGYDIWNAYECSWIQPDSTPCNAHLMLKIDAHSSRIIESKSMKLYLNSLNMERIDSLQEISDRIREDVEVALKTEVEIELNEWCESIKQNNRNIWANNPHIDLVKVRHKLELSQSGDVIVFPQFRSCCPVTRQPDWAVIYILQSGGLHYQELYQFLLDFREQADFHEACIQKIFEWIYEQVSDCVIYGRFMRRGGIDINPIRSNRNIEDISNRPVYLQ